MSDDRIHSVVYRNGRIYGALTGFFPAAAPTKTSIVWWRIAVDGSSTVVQTVNDASGAIFHGYPSLAVNKFNDVLIGFSTFSASQYPSASYTFKAYSDSATRPTELLKAGEDVFWNRGGSGTTRWGDYSATVVDPVNDTDFWTLQEYAAQHAGSLTNGSGRFGVWWGKVDVSVPSNDPFANAITLTGSTGTNTSSLYRSTKEGSEPSHAAVSTIGSTWFNWTAPASGYVTFDTLASPFGSDTVLAAYTGSSLNALTEVDSNDDAKIPTGKTTTIVPQSVISFNATAGITYRIALAAKTEQVDQIVLYWIQPQAPLFVTQPDNKYLLAGDALKLQSLAIGTPSPNYQWKSNTIALNGATYASYTNSNPQPESTNGPSTFEFLVIATNSYGAATSRVSSVTIYPSATATHDGFELLSGGRLKFTVNGISNYLYKVQVTSDFVTWTNLATNPASFFFTNEINPSVPYLFFRSVY